MADSVVTDLGAVCAKIEERVGKIASGVRCHKLPRTLTMDYTLTSKVLGQGYAGQVILAKGKNRPDETVAVKSLKLTGLTPHRKERLFAEIEIFLCMDHPHVARLLDVYETNEEVSLVMECVSGGELFQHVTRKKKFAEPGAANAMRQMLLAVHYIHNHGIVHRDLKLENFLYDIEAGYHLKMIDFGFSKFFDREDRKARMKTCCGTAAYVAPEVLKKDYTYQCDMWSLGVIGFILLSGHMPFAGDSNEKLRAIKHARYEFKQQHWSSVSKLGVEFIKALLHKDPSKRLTSKAALEHKWIITNTSEATKYRIDSSVVDSIMSWASAPKLQRACLSMVSWSFTNKQHALVRDYFVALDKDHDGMIKLAQLKDAITENGVQPSNEKTKEVHEILDRISKTSMNYSEFLAAMTYRIINLDEATVHSAFQKFDTDSSGRMTTHDFTRLLGDSFEGEDLGALLGQAGVSGTDGKIGFLEFAKCTSQQLSRMSGNEPENDIPRSPFRSEAMERLRCLISPLEPRTVLVQGSSSPDEVFCSVHDLDALAKEAAAQLEAMPADPSRGEDEDNKLRSEAPCCSLM